MFFSGRRKRKEKEQEDIMAATIADLPFKISSPNKEAGRKAMNEYADSLIEPEQEPDLNFNMQMQKENVASKTQQKEDISLQASHMKETLKQEILKQEAPEQEIPVTVDKNDAVRFVRENCQAIDENERQIAETKKEYENVTSELMDIQRIEMASEKKEITDTCKSIVALTSERNKFKDRNFTISDAQMRKFQMFDDDELVDEIKKMYNAESYQSAIESDIENLKKEKENLYAQRKEIVAKQNTIKKMTKVLAVLIFSLIVLLVVIFYALKADMTLPYLGVVFLAGVSAAALIYESSKNRRDVIVAEKKINKAVTLLNKVKIKYINNINMLDYNCKKYDVKNAKDFEQKWSEYCKMREYEKKFRENTEKLNENSENLLLMLKDAGVVDTDIWLNRCVALADPKEMVEIRHELNQRRQMLREQIEDYEQMKENTIKQLDQMINAYSDVRGELIGIIKDFNEKHA
ncbi:hypothetical protein KQI69_05105 [Eubacterium sp. MSJ-13]|uniref:hypothetical protein n=1 Tax=Eubacterium sp. MSJ-13 TaxID=2841513 RepID=UPI001C0F3D30|nr:hypothetical protein [Eubacterium sp. MSJ-13]MBU5478578.1 hypothetical protein [Eubacterium sp. MSJ-13]